MYEPSAETRPIPEICRYADTPSSGTRTAPSASSSTPASRRGNKTTSPGTPSALLAGSDGPLASRILSGEDGVMTLLTPESLEKRELEYA